MSFKKFSDDSGFKVLAMAKLTPCEYSVVLYLINCAVSGLIDVITTETEIASLIGYDDAAVRKALDSLSKREIVRLRFGASHPNPDLDSMRLGMQFDISRWHLDIENQHKITPNDAIVFPFRRQGKANLHIYTNDKEDEKEKTKTQVPTWKRIFNSFMKGRTLDHDDSKKVEEIAKILVETHHIDQLLLMIRHFGTRIPTLSLLASSWQHYLELFEEETQKVDLSDARQKHLELDEKLREKAKSALEKSTELELTEEECTVLNILVSHRHPRRQLFWAYQSRSRYPKLAGFFTENAGLMVAVTSSGKVIAKPNHPPE
jgi:DNA-binding MarR family transcriptional regulator